MKKASAWYFDAPDAVARLRAAAVEWDGTPFREHSRAPGPGGGIDCVGYCEEIMHAAGLPRFTFPRTDADYQSHRTWLRMLDYLRGKVKDDPQSARLAGIFEEIKLAQLEEETRATDNLPESLFMPGDLLVLREEGLIHLPIILDGRRFTHCLRPGGVSEGNLHDPTFSDRFVAMFRARRLTP